MDHLERQIDDDYIRAIEPHVLKVLSNIGFFEILDDILCPPGEEPPGPCQRTYDLTRKILLDKGFPREDVQDVVDVLNHAGGHCDCEVLLNLAVGSRLRTNYWTSKADLRAPHTPNA